VLFLDYETYWDTEYTLSKLPTSLYIRDPRFRAHGCAVALDDQPSEWVTHADLPAFWQTVAPMVDAVCAFNGGFDHAITAHYFTGKRFFLLDPMLMAQQLLAFKHPDLSMSLDSLGRFVFPSNPERWKIRDFIDDTKGVPIYPPGLEHKCAEYAKRDNDVSRWLFREFVGQMPAGALETVDLTLAMSVFPVLHMDTDLAGRIYQEETLRKDDTAEALGVDRAALRSDEQFAEMLRAFDVVPPTKISKRTGEQAYAFAKSDYEFKKLLGHENPVVCELVGARLGERAAQMEKRAAMFMRLPSPMPVPLGYHKAHTGRHGGEEYNLQNLKRGSLLRECIKAPPGHSIVVADLSQIELRMNAWFCEEDWLLDALRAGRDVYCELATDIYGRTITPDDEHERYVGKQGELSCGYQAGHVKFYGTMRSQGVSITEEEANRAVKTYRAKHTCIVKMWGLLQKILIPIVAGVGDHESLTHKGVRFEKFRVVLPSGRSIHYPDLHIGEDGEWKYRVNKKRNQGNERKKIYGGAMLENIVQAISYDVFTFHLRWINGLGFPPRMAVHDEAVLCVPDAQAFEAAQKLQAVMCVPPDWCRDAPVSAKSGIGKNYAEAKKAAG
jgi:DNA polymerase